MLHTHGRIFVDGKIYINWQWLDGIEAIPGSRGPGMQHGTAMHIISSTGSVMLAGSIPGGTAPLLPGEGQGIIL